MSSKHDVNPSRYSDARSKFKLEHARDVIRELSVDINVITPEILLTGMNVELEHGTRDMRTNVTFDDPKKTAKIALAHLAEGLNYYELLEEMEKKLVKPVKTMWI